MKKYRRVEINAYRRRVTIVSGEWPREELPGETTDEVSLNDSDVSEPVEPDSPEGQQILLEAVRSLEQRLSPEARGMSVGQSPLQPDGSDQNRLFLKLQSFYQFIRPKALRSARKEK